MKDSHGQMLRPGNMVRCDQGRFYVIIGQEDGLHAHSLYLNSPYLNGEHVLFSKLIAERDFVVKQWTKMECDAMNKSDERYKDCECEYVVPYGLSVMGGCEKHDV